MKIMRTMTILCGLILLLIPLAYGSDIYISQIGGGGNTGADCSNAHSAAWFNTNATGGNTYHLCGTFTGTAGSTMLTVPNSGTAGNPLIILFETDAVMTAPYWKGAQYLGQGDPGGAIAVYGKNYVIIDGGSNGIIKNTANGTLLANKIYSYGLYVKGNNIIVRNLTVKDIFVISGFTAESSAFSSATDLYIDSPATNITVCNNSFTEASIGIVNFSIGSNSTQVNDCQSNTFGTGTNIFLNDFVNHGWHISNNPSSAASPNIYANFFGTNGDWGAPGPGDNWHTDGIITYATASGLQATPYIYNNYFYGSLGTESPTAFVFCTYGAGYTGGGSACTVFNNVMVNSTPTATTAGAFWMGGDASYVVGPHKVFNNTIIDHEWSYIASNSAAVSKNNYLANNIIKTSQNRTGSLLYGYAGIETMAMFNIDYNVYYNSTSASGAWYWHSGQYSSLATWQSACSGGSGTGCDAHSYYSNPSLDGSYKATSSSPGNGKGVNLASLCSGQMAPLCYDKPPSVGKGGSLTGSKARPSSGAWDIGAYQYSGSAFSGPANLRTTP